MLSCSWCGLRPEGEFLLLGAENPAGGEWSIERWWHRTGCGRPVVLARNLMSGDAFALEPAVLPVAGPQDVPDPAPPGGPPVVVSASPSEPMPAGGAPPATTATGAAAVASRAGAVADSDGADAPPAEGDVSVGLGVGVADALTVTRTETGALIGYHWPPKGMTAGGATPAIFSFNSIGAAVAPAPPDTADALEVDDPSAEWPASDGCEAEEPEAPTRDPGATMPPADEAMAAPSADVDRADEAEPVVGPSPDEDPAEPAAAEEWPADDLVVAEADATGLRSSDGRRRRSVQEVRRPTVRPVPGWGQPTPAAQEVDVTRRAPVAVVPRRPEAPGPPGAPDEAGN